MRSIFWASPGKKNPALVSRYRMASSTDMPAKEMPPMYSSRMWWYMITSWGVPPPSPR